MADTVLDQVAHRPLDQIPVNLCQTGYQCFFRIPLNRVPVIDIHIDKIDCCLTHYGNQILPFRIKRLHVVLQL